MACSAITTTVPDIRLQKPATNAASAAKPKLRPSMLRAADGVADDDEGRGEQQERHRRERLLALGLVAAAGSSPAAASGAGSRCDSSPATAKPSASASSECTESDQINARTNASGDIDTGPTGTPTPELSQIGGPPASASLRKG